MPIEQIEPNKPNFGLIVGLFCVTLLVLLILAYLFVDYDGKHLTFRQHPRGSRSSMTLPTAERPTAA